MKRLLGLLLLFTAMSSTAQSADIDTRPVLAVLDFSAAGVSEAEALVLTDLLSTRIVESGAFRVIDRRQREAVLQEIEYSLSECSEESCQLEAGRLLSASRLVVGSVGRMGSWLIVSARLLEVASGQTLRSAAEKYPTEQALLEGAAALAARTIGQAVPGSVTAQPAAFQGARALISSTKEKQLQAELARKRRRVKATQYADWLEVKGFAGYERGAVLEEKMAFLEEYLDQANSHGHAIDLALGWSPVDFQDELSINGTAYGLNAGWSYQFDSRFAVGAALDLGFLDAQEQRGTFERAYPGFSVCAGPVLVIGDKVESFAVLLSMGLGALMMGDNYPALALRGGLYYHSFYAGYAGHYYGADWDVMTHGVEAGYSLFLGRRRTWPPRVGQRP